MDISVVEPFSLSQYGSAFVLEHSPTIVHAQSVPFTIKRATDIQLNSQMQEQGHFECIAIGPCASKSTDLLNARSIPYRLPLPLQPCASIAACSCGLHGPLSQGTTCFLRATFATKESN